MQLKTQVRALVVPAAAPGVPGLLLGEGTQAEPLAGAPAELIDAVIPWGSADQIGQVIEAYFAAGADEVALSPVGVGSDPSGSYEKTLEVLGEIARSG